MAANPTFRLIPLCKEKQRLRMLYSQAAARHSQAVDRVLLARGKFPEEELERLRALVDVTRNARTVARFALEKHKQEHGC